MAASSASARKKPQAVRKKPRETPIHVPSGWNTSDEDEINRRRSRARSEAMQVQAESGGGCFGEYAIKAGSGNHYMVEIRSLGERINSCSCADYDMNGLGTCKHVEKVLETLAKKPRKARAAGNPRVEVYVHPVDDSVRVMWPEDGALPATVRSMISVFFSADGRMLADPAVSVPVLKRAVEQTPAALSRHIRLSRRLDTLTARAPGLTQRLEAKEYFLQDVREGKRSLDIMKLPLYPYQQDGMLHLAFTERAILADEMGLGKTVQAIAACELLRRLHGVKRVLVVATTSLKAEWEEQIAKFSALPSVIVAGRREERLRQYSRDAFFTLVNYEQVRTDLPDMQSLIAPDVIILDEAQRIKNWRTKTAATIKALRSRYAFVLTGTPIENRIEDIYSIVQFLDPRFFGALFRFNREYYRMDEKGKPIGYKNLDALHHRLKPVLLRRRKQDVEGELPERTVNSYFVAMTQEQKLRYADYEYVVAKLASIARHRPLLEKEFQKLQMSLACMRMLCDTPYILDEECRICPKLEELEPLLDELLANDDTKIIIFSEWERMLELVRDHLRGGDIGYAWHTGSVEQKKRTGEIGRFKNDATCRVFLSTDAGSVGLNLQVANVVINLDIPWNPAKLEQRIARAWRKHQTRSVQVINMVSESTIEHRMLGLLKLKQALADNVLETGGVDTMDLPSGRAAMMERLDAVLGQSAPSRQPQEETAAKAQPVNPLDHFREETLARFAPRIERLEAYGNAVLAVIEGDAAPVGERMQEILAGSDPASSLQLEVLDKTAYDAIQRLVKAGILSFTGQATSLHQAHVTHDSRREEQRKRAQQARGHMDHAWRKQRMAELLNGGGFAEEARAPLTDAFETALRAFTVFAGHTTETDTPISIALIERELTQAGLPENTATLAARMREGTTDVQDILQPVQALLQQMDEHLNAATLACAA